MSWRVSIYGYTTDIVKRYHSNMSNVKVTKFVEIDNG